MSLLHGFTVYLPSLIWLYLLFCMPLFWHKLFIYPIKLIWHYSSFLKKLVLLTHLCWGNFPRLKDTRLPFTESKKRFGDAICFGDTLNLKGIFHSILFFSLGKNQLFRLLKIFVYCRLCSVISPNIYKTKPSHNNRTEFLFYGLHPRQLYKKVFLVG